MIPPTSFRLFLIFLVTLVTSPESLKPTATSTLTVKSTRKYDRDTQKLCIYDKLTLSAKYTTVICHAPCYSQTAIKDVSEDSFKRCMCFNVYKSFPSTSKVMLFMKDAEGQWMRLKQIWSYNVKSQQFEALKDLLEDDISKQPDVCEISNLRNRVENMGMHINMTSHIPPQIIIDQNQGNLLCYMTVVTYKNDTVSDYSGNCKESYPSDKGEMLKSDEGALSNILQQPQRKRQQIDNPFTFDNVSINVSTFAVMYRVFTCDVIAIQYGSYLNLNLISGLATNVWVEYTKDTGSTWNHVVDLQWKRYRNDNSNRFQGTMNKYILMLKLGTNSSQIRCRARFKIHNAESLPNAFSLTKKNL